MFGSKKKTVMERNPFAALIVPKINKFDWCGGGIGNGKHLVSSDHQFLIQFSLFIYLFIERN